MEVDVGIVGYFEVKAFVEAKGGVDFFDRQGQWLMQFGRSGLQIGHLFGPDSHASEALREGDIDDVEGLEFGGCLVADSFALRFNNLLKGVGEPHAFASEPVDVGGCDLGLVVVAA